jgi:hypothetical protein
MTTTGDEEVLIVLGGRGADNWLQAQIAAAPKITLSNDY